MRLPHDLQSNIGPLISTVFIEVLENKIRCFMKVLTRCQIYMSLFTKRGTLTPYFVLIHNEENKLGFHITTLKIRV